MTDRALEGRVVRRFETGRTWLALGWLAGLVGLSFYLWGGPWRSAAWLVEWARVAAEAAGRWPRPA